MKRIRSIVIGAALLAALAASSVSAQPASGGWVRVPACYLVPAARAGLTTHLPTCYRLRSPIFYTWVWRR